MAQTMLTISFWLSTIIIVAITNRPAAAATMRCANDHTPMCARSGNDYLLFNNECALKKAQRENLMDAPLYEVALHNCIPNCDFECDAVNQPLCAVRVASGERRTFRNRCEMMRTACKSRSTWMVHSWSRCPAAVKERQAKQSTLTGRKRRGPISCTSEYRPVCASYAGVKSTFSNECLVKAENVKTGRNWRVISDGLCGEDSIKMKHNRKYKPQSKPKSEMDRSKRSNNKLTEMEEFGLSQEAVHIYAPSKFHTEFISNSGSLVKSYSMPARKPRLFIQPKAKQIYESKTKVRKGYADQVETQAQSGKPCVFSNEPVCGTFNGVSRTFPNVCVLMEYSQSVGKAWTILHDGACRQCNKLCPTKYSPLCVSRNGLTYTIINECYLERLRCKDPNTEWKIEHRGECLHGNDEDPHSIAAVGQKSSARIPQILYSATTTTPLPPALTRASHPKPMAKPHSQPKKYKSSAFAAKDLNNRKIRKTEPEGFNLGTSNPEVPATFKLWSSKESPLYNEEFLKKRHSVKHEVYSLPKPFCSSPQLMSKTEAAAAAPEAAEPRATVSTLSPLSPLEDISEAELLTLDTKAANDIFGELEANADILLMMDATNQSTTAKVIGDKLTTAEPAEISTTSLSTTTVEIDSTSTSASSPTVAKTTTISDATEVNVATTLVDGLVSTAAATATATTETTPTTTTEADPMATTLSLDYTSQEQLENQTDPTSIYGLDKNSLIMQLLRARSDKNLVS